MSELISIIKNGISEFGILDLVDILLVTVLIYGIFQLAKGTRASQVLKGLGIILVVAWLCKTIGLTAISWLLNYLITAGATIIVILFQPEIRRALERIGRSTGFDSLIDSESDETSEIIKQLKEAIQYMAIHKTGALMVFERKVGLNDVIETGTLVDAKITSEMVENIFFINAPMHDGAMIIRDKRITAAGCFLPLSDNKEISSELGTRHRASLGISEVSDAITIVVSEETGIISMTRDGKLTRPVDAKMLDEILREIFDVNETQKSVFREKLIGFLNWKTDK